MIVGVTLLDVSALRAPRWVPVVKDRAGKPLVELFSRVPTPEEYAVVKGRVRVALAKLGELPDEQTRSALLAALTTTEVALSCVTDWRGVAMDGDGAATVTPDNLRAAMGVEAVSDGYWAEFVLPVLVLPDLEKKTFQSAPRGISAGGSDIAATAPQPGAAAPTASG